MNPKTLFYFFLGFLSVVRATVTSPSSSTIWTEGGQGQISWQSISGSSFSIVLTRVNSVYHHTITSTAPNSGSFVWTVDIPGQDGWPSSSSTDLVYVIQFYVNGGWNNGGQLVAQSDQFAIQYNGVGGNPPVIGQTTIYNNPPANGQYITTVRTQVVVGVITTTQIITEVYQVSPVNPTNTVVVSQTQQPGLVTITITNTAQLNTVTQTQVVVPQTTAFAGATTIGGPQQQLVNSGGAKVALPWSLSALGGVLCGFLFLA
jgi:hypothetical protein